MKSQLLTAFCLLGLLGLCTSLSAQVYHRCATHDWIQQRLLTDPGLADRMAEQDRFIQQHIEQAKSKRGTVYTIPVVVHVVYTSAADSASDAAIFSQIQVLNEDFRRTNADTSDTPGPWKGVAADTEIQFCLATIDPNGNPTTGITRTLSTVTNFGAGGSSDTRMKFTAQGGQDAWPRDTYLNIWVLALPGDPNLLGYSSGIGPTGPPQEDGVVIALPFFGRNVPGLNPTFNLGRTATHEVGHWFGLRHVFKDGLPDCTDNDMIPDTQPQDNPTTAMLPCPSFPAIGCANADPTFGDNFMNYMDYSPDACMDMFTAGQSALMRTFLEPGGGRSSLADAQAIGCATADASVTQILFPAPGKDVCGGTILPQIEIRNESDILMESAVIEYRLDGNLIATYTWLGTLLQNESEVISFPFINVNVGLHTLEVTIVSVNGGTDINAANNVQQVGFEALEDQGILAPYREGFEDATFPPTDWFNANPDNAISWQRTTDASALGDGAVFMDMYNYDQFGQIDELELPGIDLTVFPNKVGMWFDLAYAQYGPNTGFADTLEVWVSTDCGLNFERVYQKYGADLATSPPTANFFVPQGYWDWRREWIDLTAYKNETYFIAKFRTINNFENNLYLDNVNINEIFRVNVEEELAGGKLSVYPNPVEDLLTVDFASEKPGDMRYQLIDAQGKVVLNQSQLVGVGEQSFEVNVSNLAAGLYILHLQMEDKSYRASVSVR